MGCTTSRLESVGRTALGRAALEGQHWKGQHCSLAEAVGRMPSRSESLATAYPIRRLTARRNRLRSLSTQHLMRSWLCVGGRRLWCAGLRLVIENPIFLFLHMYSVE